MQFRFGVDLMRICTLLNNKCTTKRSLEFGLTANSECARQSMLIYLTSLSAEYGYPAFEFDVGARVARAV